MSRELAAVEDRSHALMSEVKTHLTVSTHNFESQMKQLEGTMERKIGHMRNELAAETTAMGKSLERRQDTVTASTTDTCQKLDQAVRKQQKTLDDCLAQHGQDIQAQLSGTMAKLSAHVHSSTVDTKAYVEDAMRRVHATKASREEVSIGFDQLKETLETLRAETTRLAHTKADEEDFRREVERKADLKLLDLVRSDCGRHAEEVAKEAAGEVGAQLGVLRGDLKKLDLRVESDSESVSQALRAVSTTMETFDEAMVGVRHRVGTAEKGLAKLVDESRATQDRMDRNETLIERKADEQRTKDRIADVAVELARNHEIVSARCDQMDELVADHVTRIGKLETAFTSQSDQMGDLQGAVPAIKQAMDEVITLRAELEERPVARDICSLLDTKAGLEEVNRLAVEIARELDAKASRVVSSSSLSPP